MSASASRTLNPLHFEDLEPHRFEDMVRQLLYDFRPWRSLEATGRLGGDDNFDVRGLEVVVNTADAEADEENQDGRSDDSDGSRVWLIQCKRERTIGPKKLVSYLDEILESERTGLYGIIFAAPCEFSKKSHDDFRMWCHANGLSECYLWGKAALEDMLLQPKNDHLLFAYFGFSLAIRQRSQKTRLRSISAIKRKLKKVMENNSLLEVLIRDAADDKYPFLDDGDLAAPPQERKNRWRIMRLKELSFRGLGVVYRRYFAFQSSVNQDWDVANAFNDEERDEQFDEWNGIPWESRSERTKVFEFWESLPKHERAWIEVIGYIKYEDIIEVDEIGDEITKHPHVFVNWRADASHPFYANVTVLETIGFIHNTIYIRLDDRIKRFPDHMRKEIKQ